MLQHILPKYAILIYKFDPIHWLEIDQR
eukprot:SAG22_NODE_9498_length_586_cov_1.451745_2_plen_27_part_01